MLGSLILYFKGMRLMMFQLSGFYCRLLDAAVSVRFGAMAPYVSPYYTCNLTLIS